MMYYMEVEGNFYRAEKLSLYHDGENYPKEHGQILGELDITPEFGTVAEAQEVHEPIPVEYAINIKEEIDKLTLTGSFKRGSLVMWVLESNTSELCSH